MTVILFDTSTMERHVEKLQEYVAPVQLSDEWFRVRKNMMTASDLSSALLITDKEMERADLGTFALNARQKIGSSCNPYSSMKKYVQKKCGLGEPFTGNEATRWGQMFEQVATLLYEKEKKVDVIEFGLMPHPTVSWLGASPDGITPAGVMLEIKCPMRRVFTGVPPMYYWMQMQLQMEVCSLPVCDFLECQFQVGNCMADVAEFEEHGYIIDCGGDNTYIYPPLGSETEQDEWCRQNCDLMEMAFDSKRYRKVYWGLVRRSCVPVLRDTDWFAARFPDMEYAWQEVMHCREHGLRDKYVTLKRKKKSTEFDFDLS